MLNKIHTIQWQQSGQWKDGKVITASKNIHVTTDGGKKGNYKSLKITKPKNAKLTLKKGRTYNRIKAKEIRDKLKVSRHRAVSFESTNTKVVKVRKGKVKAVGKGKATVYAYAQNGVYKTIKVTVK